MELKRLEFTINLFLRIAAGILLVTAAFISVFYGWEYSLTVEILWQILLLSAICTAGSVILSLEEEKVVSRGSMLLRQAIYYIYINIVVLLFGYWAEWFEFGKGWQVFGMVAAIAVVFIGVSALSYWSEYQVAKRMNEKLKERE